MGRTRSILDHVQGNQGTVYSQAKFLIIFGGAFPIIIINIFEYIVYAHVED